MSDQMTIEPLEQQVAQLSPQAQLKLMARISERLSAIPLVVPSTAESQSSSAPEADRLLALCDEAAQLWNDAFDVVADIRQLRHDRDEQLWPRRS